MRLSSPFGDLKTCRDFSIFLSCRWTTESNRRFSAFNHRVALVGWFFRGACGCSRIYIYFPDGDLHWKGVIIQKLLRNPFSVPKMVVVSDSRVRLPRYGGVSVKRKTVRTTLLTIFHAFPAKLEKRIPPFLFFFFHVLHFCGFKSKTIFFLFEKLVIMLQLPLQIAVAFFILGGQGKKSRNHGGCINPKTLIGLKWKTFSIS